MLIELSVTDEQLPEVQTRRDVAANWKPLKDLHETSNKSVAFFLKTLIFKKNVFKWDFTRSVADNKRP